MGQLEDSNVNAGLGCALEVFTEVEEVKSLISNISNTYTNVTLAEKSMERFTKIMGLYQEQPHLLDKNLGDILSMMTKMITCAKSPAKLQHEVFKYMAIVMKVRGYKVVIRYLPHEVSDLEFVLQLLEIQDACDTGTWQTRYCLILWLSIIVFIPFHMSKLDGFHDVQPEERLTVRQRILKICKVYCLRPDVFHVAALLASYFLKRSDVKNDHLGPFLDWACSEILQDSKSRNPCALAAVAAILKHGDREDLLPLAPNLLTTMIESNFKENNSHLIQKYVMKIIHRIGLIYLPPRVASWRYQRGNRSLEANLAMKTTSVTHEDAELTSAGKCKDLKQNSYDKDYEIENGDDDFDVPVEIEIVIEELIQGLRFSDTISRWSAAKGIGRVTNLLPRELANEVAGSVLELLSYRENDSAWHGGCLALAELGRRGLLLPERLADVVPKVLQALMYDEWRTFSSVGAHIRDAACFVCWSFARAFEASVIKPYVQKIAGTLLMVVCFDREKSCRRAASAAFQENVGRQGAFPHGIDIINKADYVAVGGRSQSFIDISVFIAQFDEYVHPLIDHLLSEKILHWDPVIRDLAAKAIFNLTPRDPEFVANALEKLCCDVDSIDLNMRHGAVLAIAEILHALAICNKTMPDVMQSLPSIKLATDKVYAKLLVLINELKSHQHFRGFGGELMKQACSHLIEKCSYTDFHISEISVLWNEWQEFLYECLRDKSESVRLRSASAIAAIFTRWYALREEESSLTEFVAARDQMAVYTVALYSKELMSENEVVRQGYALSLNLLPKPVLLEIFSDIFPPLIACCKITPPTEKWAESRREAIKALTNISRTLDANLFHKSHEKAVELLFNCFFEGFNDYTKDRRGDIGSFVREAIMTGLQVLMNLFLTHQSALLTEERVTSVMVCLAQQAAEKINRTRAHAGLIFASLIHNEPELPNIPHHTELRMIFPKEVCQERINWYSDLETFPLVIELLKFSAYTYHVLHGLVISVGGISESLLKNSSSSLLNYLKSLTESPQELERLCETILQIFQNNLSNDRVIIPMLYFLDRVISSNGIRQVLDNEESTFAISLLSIIRSEVNKSRNVNKLMASISVICQLIQVKGEVSKKSLFQLSIFLNNKFLYIRKSTAIKLYESLTLFGDGSEIPQENLDEVIALLISTNWEAEVAVLKPIRNDICDLMGISRPVPVGESA